MERKNWNQSQKKFGYSTMSLDNWAAIKAPSWALLFGKRPGSLRVKCTSTSNGSSRPHDERKLPATFPRHPQQKASELGIAARATTNIRAHAVLFIYK